ncbi:MAG: hypothetical protein M0Q92_16220 [Methanoregula sp.]|jgi:hypothetical protein|nr:hypothetical protein [Methanoregula sp.]
MEGEKNEHPRPEYRHKSVSDEALFFVGFSYPPRHDSRLRLTAVETKSTTTPTAVTAANIATAAYAPTSIRNEGKFFIVSIGILLVVCHAGIVHLYPTL